MQVPPESLIEKRLAVLEEQMADIFRTQAPRKDWQSTVGTVKDDEFSREADRLGEEWRDSVTD